MPGPNGMPNLVNGSGNSDIYVVSPTSFALGTRYAVTYSMNESTKRKFD